MNPPRMTCGNGGAILIALLVVMVTASGCGKAMPTSPVVGAPGLASQNQPVSSAAEMDGGGDESLLGGRDPEISPDPAPESTPQVIGSGGQSLGGHQKHQHKKKK